MSGCPKEKALVEDHLQALSSFSDEMSWNDGVLVQSEACETWEELVKHRATCYTCKQAS